MLERPVLKCSAKRNDKLCQGAQRAAGLHIRDGGTGAHQMTKVGRSQKSGLGEKKPLWLAGSVPSWLMNACMPSTAAQQQAEVYF